MPDRFEDMRTFAAVVQQQSFGAASTKLGIVKSAVSRRVRDLEDRLGTRLLDRTTRRLRLTDNGAAFYERCLALLAAIEQAEEEAAQGASELAGRLRISGPMSFGIHCLTSAVCAFQDLHARVTIELELDDRIIDVVREGFDLAVRISDLRDSTLIARRIALIRHAVCASPDYLRRMGTPATPAELLGHHGLGYSNVEPRAHWRFRDPRTRAVEPVEVPSVLRINNGDAMREAAVAGYGLAFLPTFIIHRAVKAGALKVVLTEYEPPPVGLYAVYASGRHLPSRTRAFIDFLVARFGGTPYWDRDVFGA